MQFLFSAILVYFMTVPGMYIMLRSRLCSSIIEALSAGFFFGFGLLVVSYLGLCRFLPAQTVDILMISASAISLVLLLRETKKRELPFWISPRDHLQTSLVVLALVFMLFSTFSDLTNRIDDDFFIHGPNIKRVVMGDIPVHMAYFPDTYLRGHTGRDLFTGIVAKFVNLRPELGIIYVTLAVCPVYILMFHALAWRLSRRRRISTCFCFFGLLFLVSGAIGPYEMRAGAITYIGNNNELAFSHAVFIAWLIERVICYFAGKTGNLFFKIFKSRSLIGLCILAYVSMYFIYISNFILFSAFLACLPILIAVLSKDNKGRQFLQSTAVVGVVAIGCLLMHLIISPLLFERVLISLNLYYPSEPLGMMQQGHLTIPKPIPFSITDPAGADIPFFTVESMKAQGLSFYIGICGLLVGLASRSLPVTSLSVFGCIAMLWLLLVDMGEYRAETLRILLSAHIAFGAACALVIADGVERTIEFIERNRDRFGVNVSNLGKATTIAITMSLCIWMARGSVDKFIKEKPFRIAKHVGQWNKIHERNPEDWFFGFNVKRIDYEAFESLARYVRDSRDTVLLRLTDSSEIMTIAHLTNAATVSGAGIVGVCQAHMPDVVMGAHILPYGYRASLFWNRPTKELLADLSPDFIIVDPSLVSQSVLEKVLAIPGVKLLFRVEDDTGQQRLLLKCEREKPSVPTGSPLQMILSTKTVESNRHGLIELPVSIESGSVPAGSQRRERIEVKMLVFDDHGKPANTRDVPHVGVTHLCGNEYKLSFSMIQTGNWHVQFVDPSMKHKLNETPLRVLVSDKVAVSQDQAIK